MPMFWHLAGNMLFSGFLATTWKDFFRTRRHIYSFICSAGLVRTAACALQFAFQLPAVGASGAISGVMGAYMLLYPRARILTLVFIFPLPIPAVVFLGLWYVLQFLAGSSTIGANVTGGVAVWAHVGGSAGNAANVHGQATLEKCLAA